MFSPKDKVTRKPRGFTFCQYRRKEDAEDAVKGMDKRVGSTLEHDSVLYTSTSHCLALQHDSVLYACTSQCGKLLTFNDIWKEEKTECCLIGGRMLSRVIVGQNSQCLT